MTTERPRSTYLGGSDAAAVLGLSPWATPYQVWLRKTGRQPEPDDAPHLRRGRELEKLVARRYAEATGARLRREPRLLVHPRHPMLAGHIDRWGYRGGERIVVELKTALRCDKTAWGEPGSDQIPPAYAAQCLHYAGITGVMAVDLAVLDLTAWEVAVYHIRPDRALVDALAERLAAWWREHVEADVPPALTPRDDPAQRWPIAVAGRAVQSDAETRELLRRLREARARRLAAEAEEEELARAVQARMGDAELLLDGNRVAATWRSYEVRRLDSRALRERWPEVAEACTALVTQRRFILREESDA